MCEKGTKGRNNLILSANLKYYLTSIYKWATLLSALLRDRPPSAVSYTHILFVLTTLANVSSVSFTVVKSILVVCFVPLGPALPEPSFLHCPPIVFDLKRVGKKYIYGFEKETHPLVFFIFLSAIVFLKKLVLYFLI